MKVGASVGRGGLAEATEAARAAEDLGYDYITSAETAHNPFLPLVLAAEHTRRLELRTSIALAFARSPMDVAYLAWDLQTFSGGRFVLGLGSQVRGHIVRRFSMPWGAPAARMREYVQALRHIWRCWQEGKRLDFQGRFYSMNLMPPFFDPGPQEHPDIKVYVAAVNPRMLQVAGEVCDGVVLHSFCTARYVEEVVLPNLREGLRRSGRGMDGFDVVGGGFVVTGGSDEELARRREELRRQIAFYASTPSYRPVMETHGWGEVADRLYRMSVEGRWRELPTLITDEMVDAFVVVGRYEELPPLVRERYGHYATSLTLSVLPTTEGERRAVKKLIQEVQGL